MFGFNWYLCLAGGDYNQLASVAKDYFITFTKICEGKSFDVSTD